MKSDRPAGGVGFSGLLLLLFIGLKLAGFIDWSWWWVLSPIWIPVAVLTLVLLVLLFFGVMDDVRAGRG